ncbi:hypothetical protein ACFE04_020464 [Oxalis oulophora]
MKIILLINGCTTSSSSPSSSFIPCLSSNQTQHNPTYLKSHKTKTNSPSISTVHSSPSPLLSNPYHHYSPKHYACLEELDIVLDRVMGLGEGDEKLQFMEMFDVEDLANGVLSNLHQMNVKVVIEVLRKVERVFGVEYLRKLFDHGVTFDLLKKECQWVARHARINDFVQLMETLAGFQVSIKQLVDPSAIIKICVDKREPELSIRYASILPHAEILFCNIIREFGKKQDLSSAFKAYGASKKYTSGPNMFVYRTIIDVCGLCNGYMKSRYIYEDLLKQKIVPNIYVFNSLMNVNAHDLSYSLHVYKNMQDLGVPPDMASYNILLKACCLGGRVDLAQDIYKEVKNLESAGELKLDVFTYCTIVKVFADAKLWQMALKIKDDMITADVTPNTPTWSSFISACANAGLVEKAIHLFEEMLIAGCEPNSQCCNTLLHACVEARQYDRAFRLFQSWMGASDEYFHGKHLSLASSVSDSRLFELAKGISFKPTNSTYNILMKACGTDFYRAKALMGEMRRVGLSPNHISWSILIDICGASGNADGAIQILRNMCAAAIKPDVVAFTTAIKVCVESKKLRLAFSLFAEMKRQQIQPNMVTYNTLLRARSKYGSLREVQQCLAIYQDMRKAGYKSNDYYLKELIEEWCEGVICHNSQKQGEFDNRRKGDLGRPWSHLIEKVATHLEMSNTESLAIDLQELTKVEARIVVLAVLRMIKENYATGREIKDDIFIIIGVYEVNADLRKPESEVKDAMVKLLQGELGLEVLLAGPGITFNREEDHDSRHCEDQNLEVVLGGKEYSSSTTTTTRRPAILQRLKVTRKSLHNWLHRRECVPR